MAKRVIFSDLHFGDSACSLRFRRVAEGLRKYLHGHRSIEEIILAGDILDTNISSFTTAMFGVGGGMTPGSGSAIKWPKQIGLQGWLTHLLADGDFKVNRIVYIPGNHDYKTWDLIATQANFMNPVAAGERPTKDSVPLMEGEFSHSFISGLAPKSNRRQFVVVYPDYLFHLGEKKVLVTHGHYLDKKQTMGKSIEDALKEKDGNKAAARRLFFQRTAQYQAVASAVSYVETTRNRVDSIHKMINRLYDMSLGSLRNKPIDGKQLKAIEQYLFYYRQLSPDIFIFGHTHEAGHSSTASFRRTENKRLIKKIIDVWNTGCFLDGSHKNWAGSFIFTDDKSPAGNQINLVFVKKDGNIVEGRM